MQRDYYVKYLYINLNWQQHKLNFKLQKDKKKIKNLSCKRRIYSVKQVNCAFSSWQTWKIYFTQESALSKRYTQQYQ